ncbi:hypothetical protein Bbelb_059120 [Branchiostoma belcheri]|nr:hypothetical protein Bbelb_059120 [Branchiostoma belcheri]
MQYFYTRHGYNAAHAHTCYQLLDENTENTEQDNEQLHTANLHVTMFMVGHVGVRVGKGRGKPRDSSSALVGRRCPKRYLADITEQKFDAALPYERREKLRASRRRQWCQPFLKFPSAREHFRLLPTRAEDESRGFLRPFPTLTPTEGKIARTPHLVSLCGRSPDATDVRHGVPVLRGDFTLIGQGDAELLEQPASLTVHTPVLPRPGSVIEMNRDELATQIFILGLTGRDPKEQFTSTRHISRKDGRTSDHQPTGRAGRHSRSQSKLRRSPDCSKRFDCGNPAEKNKSPDGWENFDFENPAAGALVAPVPERSFFNSG